jgi:hypothetical protein
LPPETAVPTCEFNGPRSPDKDASEDANTRQRPFAPMELSVINPGAVLGPVLNRHYSTSGEIVRKLMAKELAGRAKLGLAWVDERVVAMFDPTVRNVVSNVASRFRICSRRPSRWDTDR